MQIHWSGATRFHDWAREGRAVPREMLARARSYGLIGEVDWTEVGIDDNRQRASEGFDSLDRLVRKSAFAGDSLRIAAGGSKPNEWETALVISPFDRSLGQNRRFNVFNLWFDSEAYSEDPGSDTLAEALAKIHTPDNTEFAFIHPYQRWSELSDVLDGQYQDPLTIGPMFSGVYWSIFLDKHHLQFFDVPNLGELDAFEVRRMDDNGLYLRVCRNISDATKDHVECDMFRLTEQFRNALTRNS